MIEEQFGMERCRWKKNRKVYGKGQMVEEQQGMERGRWWKHSKVCKGEHGGRIARYGQGVGGGRIARYVKEQMVKELQGMEEGWARN